MYAGSWRQVQPHSRHRDEPPGTRNPVDAALEASCEEQERVCPPTEPLLPLPVRIWFSLRNFPALPSPGSPLAMGLPILP